MPGRDLKSAGRRFADHQTERLAERPTSYFVATVTAYATGQVTLDWRGSSIVALGRCASYTPAVGDRVLCALVDSQPVVIDQMV